MRAAAGAAKPAAVADTSPAVRIDSLRCEVGGRVTLDLPRWRVQPGERVAIVGHNGAGKSTLLRCLSGFTRLTSGSVVVLGQRVDPTLRGAALRRLRCEVGQVMQGLHLTGRLSVLDNVLIGVLGRLSGPAAWRSWLRWYDAAPTQEALRALDAAGLSGRTEERVDRLSGGERQKVAIARLLMQRPRLILADEPTASLDPTAAREVCERLTRAAAGATLISVVHDTRMLTLLADRVIGLRQGRCLFDLPVGEVSEQRLAALYGGQYGGEFGGELGPSHPARPPHHRTPDNSTGAAHPSGHSLRHLRLGAAP